MKNNKVLKTILLIILGTCVIGGVAFIINNSEGSVQKPNTSSNESYEKISNTQLSNTSSNEIISSENIELDGEIKTFYESMIIDEDIKSLFTYEDNKICFGSQRTSTSFDIGSYQNNYYSVVDIDLTATFSTSVSSFGISFNKSEDGKNRISLSFDYQSIKCYRYVWDYTTNAMNATSIDLPNLLYFDTSEKFNLKVLCCDNTRKLLLNDESVIEIDDDIGKGGCFSIGAALTRIEIENGFYKEYDTKEEFNKSQYFKYI